MTESGHVIYPIEGIEEAIALGPGGSNWGQMLFLAESILVICQIEGVEGAIALVPVLLNYIFQDGRQTVKMSFS